MSYIATITGRWALGAIVALGMGGAQAQVVPDGSLGTIVEVSALEATERLLIQGGAASGANLFHSFQGFDVPRGAIAEFTAGEGIERIFGRVTGADGSLVEGTLRSPVDLFLINPNGITFGEAASLEVAGSFYATTADAVEFADGLTFTAQLEADPPLLSLDIPVGLGFGTIAGQGADRVADRVADQADQTEANSGAIVNRSQTIGVGLDGNPAPVGLNAAPTQALGLIGGDVAIVGGVATAIDGQLAAIALRDGVWSLGGEVSDGAVGGQLTLEAGLLNTSGLSGGGIQLFGADITLTNGAGVVADGFGAFPGRGIVASGDRLATFGESFLSANNFNSGTNAGIALNFSDTIAIDGIGPYITVGRLLSGTVGLEDLRGGLYALPGGTAQGGDIELTAPTIALTNGASVFTTVIGFGRGGDIRITADSLLAAGGSFVLTSTVAPGMAGDLFIDTRTLLSVGGGVFNTSPSGEVSGDGGDFELRAEHIEVRDVPAGVPIPGSILATTLGSGDAGRLTIDTETLVLSGGGQVTVSSSGAGRGGELILHADTIEIDGASEDGLFLSGIYASSGLLTVPGTRGDASAGSIDLTARQLILRDGGQVSAAVGNGGDAGNVRLEVTELIELSGVATNVDPSVERVSFGTIGDGIVPTAIEANTSNSGNAGNVEIITGELRVRDAAELGVRGTSSGNAGELSIAAGDLTIQNGGQITAATASGTGGNITLAGDRLMIQDRSRLSATASGSGNGGNLHLEFSQAVVGLDGSTILADADRGNGGQITIQAPGLFLSPDSRLSASSNFGQSGAIAVRSPNIDPGATLVNLTTETANSDVVVPNLCRSRADNHSIIVGRNDWVTRATATHFLPYPLHAVQSSPVAQGDRDTTPTITPTIPPPIQEAQRFQRAANGDVALAPQPIAPPDNAPIDAQDAVCTMP